jgi:hypothetical protein
VREPAPRMVQSFEPFGNRNLGRVAKHELLAALPVG